MIDFLMASFLPMLIQYDWSWVSRCRRFSFNFLVLPRLVGFGLCCSKLYSLNERNLLHRKSRTRVYPSTRIFWHVQSAWRVRLRQRLRKKSCIPPLVRLRRSLWTNSRDSILTYQSPRLDPLMQIVHVGKCMMLSYEEKRGIKRTQSDPFNELQTNRILL